jgi:hypothetical protein
VLAALLVLAACGGEDSVDPRVCEPRVALPSQFERLPSFEEEYRDHVGVRLGYRDPQRRELHVAAGIPGEWTEGMAEAGSVTMTGDRDGVLAGNPSRDVWVVMWNQGDVCDPRVVLGNGFAKREFLKLLRDAGIAAPHQ